MDVKVRDVCLKCGGTGKNQKTYESALDEAINRRQRCPGGIIAPGSFGPEPVEAVARRMMICGYCEDGYNERWVGLSELLSVGI